nr:hypothetical protein [Tanacetum cinerariifolium]
METKDTLSSCSNLKAQQMQQIQDKAKKSCMVSFRQLHSYLKRLSQNDLQGSRTESGFKRAFATIFGQDIETFTSTMFLNVEQLEKQLDKEDFQEIGSMASFNVLETQFQMFITSRLYLNDEYVAKTRNYFQQYTQQAIPEFRDTLIQHLEYVKKSIDERVQLNREYDSWVNERQMQTTEEKVDTSKALDASSVDTESSRTESKEQDTSSRSGNDVLWKQHTEQPEFNNKGKIDQNAEECHDTCPLPAILIDNLIHEHSYQSLESENICLKKTVAQFQKDFSRLEAHYVTLELKYQNHALKEGQQSQFSKEKRNSVNTKFAKPSILEKPMLQSHRNQSVVRQLTAFKSERPRILKPRCDSQVDVNYDLSKLLTTHYLPKEREDASAKPHHMIASSNSRISSKNMPRFTSNDMVHNHYLEEAKKKIQERSRNSEPSLIPSARSQSTTNGSKPKPRSNTQTSRNWLVSKSSFATTKTVSIAEHPRNSKNDSCVTKFLKEVNLRAKVPSNKTTNKNKPVEQISVAKKPERQIPKGHRFSIKKTFVVHEKTITPRSCLRWKPTGRIFKTVGLRWITTGKIFTSSTTKVDSEPLNGSNVDITNNMNANKLLIYLINQGFKEFSTDEQVMTSDHNSSELGLYDHNNEQSSSKLVPNVVPLADKTDTSRQELEFIFHHHITMLSLIPAESDSSPHAHAQNTKTY